MATSNKVIRYHKNNMVRASAKLAKLGEAYLCAINATIKSFNKFGFFDEELRTAEMEAYLAYVKGLLAFQEAENKYLTVKGLELCQEESR